MPNGSIDFDTISTTLANSRTDWLPREFPNGRIEGQHFKIGNAQGDPGESLPIPLDGKHRRYRDFAGEFSGDDLDLIASHRGLSMTDAARQVAGELGLPEPTTNGDGKAKGNGKSKLGPPDLVYTYTDAAGSPVMEVRRWEATATRKKVFVPYHLVSELIVEIVERHIGEVED